jgi:Ni,Fe-hydrogenase I cytochrome b subunit
MLSLYDYQGHADKDWWTGLGDKVNAYAQLRKQPYKKRYVENPVNNSRMYSCILENF